MIHLLHKLNSWFKSEIGFFLLFLLVFSFVTIFVGLYEDINSTPSGIHLWRQTDGISQVIHYEENGLNFFDHGVAFNQLNNGGKAVGELPLPYYFSAIINTFFGHKLWHIRLVWLLFLVAGIFSLSKLIFQAIKVPTVSVFIAHTLFFSHIFNAYALNFLPDPIALSCSIMGAFAWMTFGKNQKKRYWLLSALLIAVSGAIKPFYLLPLIAASLVLMVDGYVLNKNEPKRKLIKIQSPFLTGVALTIGWFSWSFYYNNVLYPNDFFLSELMPIWETSLSDVKAVFHTVSKLWISEYYALPLHLSILIFLLVVVFLALLGKHKADRQKLLFVWLSLAGALSYFMLMFQQFMHHDYYAIPVLFLIPVLLTLIYTQLGRYNRTLVNVVFFAGFVLLMWKHKTSPSIRHQPWLSESYKVDMYKSLKKNLPNSNGKVLVLTEEAPQTAHYFLGMKGWSKFNVRREGLDNVIDYDYSYVIANKKDTLLLQKFRKRLNKAVYSDSVVIVFNTK